MSKLKPTIAILVDCVNLNRRGFAFTEQSFDGYATIAKNSLKTAHTPKLKPTLSGHVLNVKNQLSPQESN